MKRLGIMIGALALVLGMSQCRKPVETINAAPQGETVDVTVSVTSGADKTEITPAGAVTWKAGDKLYVVGVTDGLLGSVSATAAGDPALFSGKIKALTEAQTLKFYYVGDSEFTLDGSGKYTFSIENQDGSLAGIAANNQLMFGKTASEVAVGTADLGTISMTSVTAIAHFNIRDDGGNAVAGPVTVTGGFASSTFNAKTYAGETLTGTAGDMTMTFATGTMSTGCHMALLPGSQTLTFTTSDGKTKTLAAKDVASNTFYNSGEPIEVKVRPSYLPGEFTVDGSDTKVKFSKGNLYAKKTGTEWEWGFYEHQYDMNSLNSGGSRTATSADAEIDLFTWGYGTWSTDPVGTDYQAGTFTDWGEIESLPDAGEGKRWRTLTNDEWKYLLNTSDASSGARTDANRFAKAKVNDVRGLLIFPDGYNGGAAIGAITGVAALNTPDADFPTEDIPTDTWTGMETAGVVFLPAAGGRYGAAVYSVGSYGLYWSSTPLGSGYAYGLYFYSDGVGEQYNTTDNAYNFRLVRSDS